MKEAEAGILYDKSIELYNRKNAELWQKAGFIYQKIGEFDLIFLLFFQHRSE